MSPNTLTPKQQNFVDQYFQLQNGTQAYYASGYKVANATVASVESTRLLANPSIRAALAIKGSAIAARLEVTQDDLIQEYRKVAFSDPRALPTWNEKVKALDSMAARLWPVIERSESVNLNVNVDLMQMVEVIKQLNLSPEQLATWGAMLDEELGER